MKKSITILFALAVVFVFSVQAHADEIYSTLSSDNSYNSGIASGFGDATIYGGNYPYPDTIENNELALQFTPSNDFYLDSIDLALWNAMGSNIVNIHIAKDIGGIPDDTSILESISVTAFPDWESAVVTGNFSGTTTLSQGTPYWVWLSSEGENAWYYSNTGISDVRAFRRTTDYVVGSWVTSNTTATAYRVTGSPIVPEPISSILFLIGGAVLGFRQLRKRVS